MGADVNKQSSGKGMTALGYSALYAQESATRLLLERNAEVDLPNIYEETALFCGVWAKSASIVKLLLD